MRRIPLLVLVALLGCGDRANRKPKAEFQVSPARPVVGELAHFDGSPSRDRDGRITEYAFEWGESTERWSRSPSPYRNHVFEHTGVFWVRLQVTDNDGARTEAVQPVEVVLPGEGDADNPSEPAGEAEVEAREDEAPEPDAEPAGEDDAGGADGEEEPAGEADALEDDGGEPDADAADGAEGELEVAPYTGYITLLESVGKTRDSVQARTSFARPVDQDCGAVTESEVHEIGECRVTLTRTIDPGTPCDPTPTASGGLITVHGTQLDPLLIAPSTDEEGRVTYVSNLTGDEVRLFAYGTLLPIEVAGDPAHGVAAAAGALLTPADFQVVAPDLKDPDLVFPRGESLQVTWTGAIDDGSRRLSIVLTANPEDRSVNYNGYCTPLDTGAYAIPAGVTALLPAGARVASLMLTRGEHATLYSEEHGRIIATATIYRGGSGELTP